MTPQRERTRPVAKPQMLPRRLLMRRKKRLTPLLPVPKQRPRRQLLEPRTLRKPPRTLQRTSPRRPAKPSKKAQRTSLNLRAAKREGFLPRKRSLVNAQGTTNDTVPAIRRRPYTFAMPKPTSRKKGPKFSFVFEQLMESELAPRVRMR